MSKLTLAFLCGLFVISFLVASMESHSFVISSEGNSLSDPQAASLSDSSLSIDANITAPLIGRRSNSDFERLVWCQQYCWKSPLASQGVANVPPNPYGGCCGCWRYYDDPNWQDSSAPSILGSAELRHGADLRLIAILVQVLAAFFGQAMV